MNKPQPPSENMVYGAIVGISMLLCFAFLLTSNVWLTMAIIALGMLHLLRFHPDAEAYIATDPLLAPIRRYTPLIVIGILALQYAIRPT